MISHHKPLLNQLNQPSISINHDHQPSKYQNQNPVPFFHGNLLPPTSVLSQVCGLRWARCAARSRGLNGLSAEAKAYGGLPYQSLPMNDKPPHIWLLNPFWWLSHVISSCFIVKAPKNKGKITILTETCKYLLNLRGSPESSSIHATKSRCFIPHHFSGNKQGS